MNEPQPATDFVKRLLAQEPTLAAPAFAERRRLLLARLASAEHREQRSRRVTLAVVIAAAAGFFLLYAAAMDQFGKAAAWPEWAKYLGGVSILLLPFTAFLLTVIYFFRHRRELLLARDEAFRTALENLPRQIDDLRAELETLRQQAPPPSGSAAAKRDEQRAFTLLEMMVVVAILGVLAGLLFPALARAKARSQTVVCGSNLGQLGKELTLYEHEAGTYPGAGQSVWITNQVVLRSDDSWEQRLRPQLGGNTNVFSCPAYQPPAAGSIRSPAYGYNANGCARIHDFRWDLGLGYGNAAAGARSVGSSDVRAPADMIAIGDIQLPPGLWLNSITPNLPQRLGGLDSIVPARHNGGANMVFCDGHNETARLTNWIQATDGARRRWNRDHLPHAETW